MMYISITYRDHDTLYIGQQLPITVYKTGFWVCVVLVLIVIKCSCHYLLDRILFRHDFIMIVVTIIGIFMFGMFPPLDILLEYWI